MKSVSAALLMALTSSVSALPSTPNSVAPGDLFARQNEVVCCFGECAMRVKDDPEEKDWDYHVQVTSNHECSDGDCSVSELSSKTVGWSITAGANTPWASIAGGWQESVTTGSTYTCSGTAGETVCVWARIPHVERTVEKSLRSIDTCDNQPDEARHRAPTGEYTYYCVRNEYCRGDGGNWWDEL